MALFFQGLDTEIVIDRRHPGCKVRQRMVPCYPGALDFPVSSKLASLLRRSANIANPILPMSSPHVSIALESGIKFDGTSRPAESWGRNPGDIPTFVHNK